MVSPAWRARYGDELAALLEDTYGDGRLPVGVRFSLIRGGSLERLRGSPLAARGGSTERVRSGALLVLCAWAVVVLAGAGFAKASEHWDAVLTPAADRRVPAAGYDAVQGAALVGLAAVVTGAALCLPSLTRFLRDGGWPRVRRAVTGAAVVTAVTLVAGLALVAWAHRLDPAQRNGGSGPYGVAAVGGALLVVATIAAWVRAVVLVVADLDLPGRVVRACGALALGVTVAAAVVLAGTVTWWSSLALDAPRFLTGWTVGPAGPSVSVPLLAAGVLMAAGLVVAVWGSWRVGRHLARVAD